MTGTYGSEILPILERLAKCNPQLKKLVIQRTHGLKDVVKVFSKFSRLEFLDLTQSGITTLELSNPCLKSLFLCWMPLRELLLDCPRLVTMDMSGCNELEDKSFTNCLKMTGWSIQNMWLKNLSVLSDSFFAALPGSCPNVAILNLSGSNVNQQTMLKVIYGCKKLRRVYLNGSNIQDKLMDQLSDQFPKLVVTQREGKKEKQSKEIEPSTDLSVTPSNTL